jgi:tetratricopeptide (TPR) repeat protein
VLDLITRLAEHSLAAVQAESGRYRMLDTVRHYAGGRLQESADEVTTRERHAAFFADFVERAHPHLIGADQGEWMDHLDSERENLAAAFAWCERSQRGAELAVRLVSVLKYYWLSRGALATGYGHAITAVQLAANRGDVVLQARALSDAGTIATFLGRYTDARGHLERGLALARRAGDTEQEFVFLQYLSEVESARGNFETALNYCDAAHALASSAGKTRMRTVTLNAKGQLLRVLGRLAEAQELYEQALAVARSLGDEEFVAGILLNLAIAAILSGRSAAVPTLLQEVAAIYARTGSQSTGQSLLEVCAGLATELQQWDTAAAFVADAGAQALQSGLERDPADQAFVMHLTELVSARIAIPTVHLTETSFDLRAAVARAVDWIEQLQPRSA